ncbi:TPA: restriction endonuclease subunit S [Pseudomonas aeruginosa]|nr:restriction endonuclease subunit S [Pseudomonas aeruginosa]HBO3267459.1 restriction endonuclease subunit S [Pseudomonas aeruginosa]HBO4461675.1 restriction endonuclease subunit S [Pseudomonas aeruginosa]HCF5632913.1 restriction endonuclease subunit S [Pseudomonas aeruginosa]HCL4218577.1 restriction endonuclease subunit S [Pseudomonas aeruginosa]
MMEENKQALVPKLRFPEFREAGGWKYIPLNRLAIRAKQKNRDGKIDRVLTNSAEFGVVDQRNFFDKDIATQGKLEGYVVVEFGSYVYNPRVSSIAPVGPISKNKIGTGVMSPLYTVFKFKDDRNDFYEHFFKTTGWHTYIRKASSTGARHDRMAISSDDFMAMPLPGSSPAEQQKIADCLSSLDELIALQVRKVDALKTHKKGLMQQLFPREGETQPRLRFPEFMSVGGWEEKPFSNLCSIKHGFAFDGEFFSNEGEYVLLTPGNFYEDGGYRDRGDKQKYYSGEIPKDYILNCGDLLLAMTEQAAGLLGSPMLVPESDKFLHNQRLGLVRKKSGTAWMTEFFFHVFNTQPVRKAIHANATGAKVRHTSPTKIGEVVFHFPNSLLEQQRIVGCLTTIDDLITVQTKKLEALKAHKKGLIQKLFPPIEVVEA